MKTLSVHVQAHAVAVDECKATLAKHSDLVDEMTARISKLEIDGPGPLVLTGGLDSRPRRGPASVVGAGYPSPQGLWVQEDLVVATNEVRSSLGSTPKKVVLIFSLVLRLLLFLWNLCLKRLLTMRSTEHSMFGTLCGLGPSRSTNAN